MKKYLNKILTYYQQHRLPLVLVKVLQELRIIDHDSNPAYSQEGEDLILHAYLFKKNNGFYIDIGANHPKKFSSTYLFYLKGWQGISIDPWPEAKKLFARYRPFDVFVNCGVANADGLLDYFCFSSSLMNTFNARTAEALKNDVDKGCRLLEIKKVRVRKLTDILEENKHFIAGRQIDLMNVDVEDGELAVLLSNDWEKYSPNFVAIEIHGFDLNQVTEFAVHNFLVSKNYNLVGKTQLTAIYRRKDYEV